MSKASADYAAAVDASKKTISDAAAEKANSDALVGAQVTAAKVAADAKVEADAKAASQVAIIKVAAETAFAKATTDEKSAAA